MGALKQDADRFLVVTTASDIALSDPWFVLLTTQKKGRANANVT
ncbi:hypothetical protein CLOSTMETH_00474 [[Clostridium] methylpentosum DSM 5476]|uniref:Uncharacterized protein n=1 Tax=[Clostridium] methylpentosum DSM 5476 TaxID=537013 RepID=C0E9H5_9FIRM|nr:hypothetical protein CLOSTMETH_00474 [[Clostridium] methylpentosum DSM 5476]